MRSSVHCRMSIVSFLLVLGLSLPAPKSILAENATETEKKKSEDGQSKQASPDDGTDESTEKKRAEVKPDTVHLLKLSGLYVDKPDPFGLDPMSLLLGASAGRQKSFFKLCDYIDDLAKDNDTQHVVLDLSALNLSMNSAQLDEMTRRIHKLKKSGKTVYAWLESTSNVPLALAAACDKVLLADFGVIDFPSVSLQSMFFRDAMDLLGVKASIVRAGDFKGAVEPYTNSVMSEHLRAHYTRMLKTMNDALVDRIVVGRGLTTDQVRDLQSQRILLPEKAHQAGLVDRLVPLGQKTKSIEAMIGKPVKWTTVKKKAKRQMSFFELMGKIMGGPSTKQRVRETSIAVLHLSGVILDGTSSSAGMIVSGPTIKEIGRLVEDKNIKGVVIRINSPGGSATASEAIRGALKQLAEKKPTVVSMGNVAASGGYWVSCIGTPVYAERGTLTGSIGVFSMKLSFGSLMRRLGIHLESIALDDSAKTFAMDRDWTESDKRALGEFVHVVYDRFLKLVSDSRSLSVDEVRPIAGGRVWSGAQAKALGLIDQIGGLAECLQDVAKRAKVDDYRVIHRPTSRQGLDILDLLSSSGDDDIHYRLLDSAALKLLRAKGMPLRSTLVLLNHAAKHRSVVPSVWALVPMELQVR